MATRLEGGIVVADNEYDFREVCRALGVPDSVSIPLAEQTRDNILKAMRKEGVEGRMDKWYNTYRMAMDRNLNAFLTHTKLEPIAHLFRLRCNVRIASGNKRYSHEYFTFTILKQHYDYFRKHGKAPRVHNNGAIAKYDNAPRTLIQFDGGGNVKLPQNETFARFKKGIKVFNAQNGTNYTIPQMLLMIMEQFMKDKPTIFGDKAVKIDESKLVKTETDRLHLTIPTQLMNDFKAFVQRYNALFTPKTTMNESAALAIRQFLDRKPLYLVDPKAYAEELALREQLKQSR